MDVTDIIALLPAGGASVLLIALATKVALRWLRASDEVLDIQDQLIDELRDELNRLAIYRDEQLPDHEVEESD